MMRAQAFRPRLSRLDFYLAKAMGIDGVDMDGGELEPSILQRHGALSFGRVFPPAREGMPGHFGHFARSAWTYVDDVFKAADFPEDSPPDAYAKSVQIADIYESFLSKSGPTVYLELTLEGGLPALAPFPKVPNELMDPGAELTAEDTRSALVDLTWRVCERLNALLPVARSMVVAESRPIDQ